MKSNAETQSVSERSSKLADEILGAHTTRADYLKWKLILVAALGAAGFGLEGKGQLAPLFLALIPFVCIYVDLLCANLNARIIVIGTFFAMCRRDPYERFVQGKRDVFDTEDWALHGSTLVVCFIVILIGEFSLLVGSLSKPTGQDFWQWPLVENLILVLAGSVGFWLSLYTSKISKEQIESLARQTDTQSIQNRRIAGLLHADYMAADLSVLRGFLEQKGVFIFQSFPNGLFPAAAALSGDVSGYQYVWVRDNVHIAHAHYVCGDKATAGRTLSTLMRYFQKYANRFEDIIGDKTKTVATDPMNRPHIRFDGGKLEEISQPWAHAQNDALGYFLWCYCKLAREGIVNHNENELECLAKFPLYFQAIEYWQDWDSGHWEETRKVSASSIGTVVAGLREFEILLEQKQLWSYPVISRHKLTGDWLKHLRQHGVNALHKILPCESIEPEERYRRYDSALLFLIYPLEVLAWDKARVILEDVKTHLQGDYGIRRYLGDSYWFPDYKKKFLAKERTADYSGSTEKRDAGVRVGEEAQWCIFDPVISVIYGQRYLIKKQEQAGGEADELLRAQTAYFNRALGQLTGKSKGVPEFRAPEAYYLEKGHYMPNDHTPLLWSQANLWLALNQMQQSVERINGTDVDA
jgi:phosphorylase kinase alpha/beta subunit